MPAHRVLYTDYAWPDVEIEREILAPVGAELVLSPDKREETLIELAKSVDAIMTCWAPTTARVIDAVPHCHIIARTGIGLDNIDVAHATKRGIVVTNVPDYCYIEVAEHTLALILALGRKLHLYRDATRAGRYDLMEHLPFERMTGQTVGLVGLGRIGQRLAPVLQELGFRVVGTNRSKQSPPGVQWRSRDELLSESDYVVLVCPLTSETRHLINAQSLARMKPTAYLVNTSRGGLVDHAALAAALDNGRLAGAALDVQDPEPPDLSQPPYNDPRVLVTPHAAFSSTQAVNDLRTRVAHQVAAKLRGETPENVVNPEVLRSE
ncbi:MAG: C-terminal binding protein [Pirellulales bacterium]